MGRGGTPDGVDLGVAVKVDLRCPVYSIRLFGRVLTEGTIVEGNLIEVACTDCRKARRAMGDDCSLVLHRFNVLGDCVESEVVA